jgi:hypothetical protein
MLENKNPYASFLMVKCIKINTVFKALNTSNFNDLKFFYKTCNTISSFFLQNETIINVIINKCKPFLIMSFLFPLCIAGTCISNYDWELKDQKIEINYSTKKFKLSKLFILYMWLFAKLFKRSKRP